MFKAIQRPQAGPRRIGVRRACAHDEAGLALFYAGLGRLTLRRRFHCAIQALSSGRIQQLSRLSYEDPAQVRTFVAVCIGTGKPEVVGHAGWRVDAPGSAEFALVVADAFQGQGLGQRLLDELIASARQQGLQRLHASVLRDNDAMVGLLRQAGVAVQPDRSEPGLVRAEIEPLAYQPPRRRRTTGGVAAAVGAVAAGLAAGVAAPVLAAWRAVFGAPAVGGAS